MIANLESGNVTLRLWFMIHRAHELCRTCEDRVFSQYGLTTEHYTVLSTIKYLEAAAGAGRVRPTDVARWLGRSPNSISMIADRMVKAGLLRRIRDRADRRVVFLVITSKGEDAVKPATLAGFELVQKLLSQLSQEDRLTLIKLLQMVQYGASKYLNPEADMEEVERNEAKSRDNLIEQLLQYCPEVLKPDVNS
jgi:DNA-binding MarR family transcriptional regulator